MAKELWDILDAKGNPTGRVIERGKPLAEGEYMLAVHIYIVNSKGEYLMQKRSSTKEVLPGVWDTTGGAVTSGEDSRLGALREVEEEIGIILELDEQEYVTRIQREQSFVDIWFIKKDIEVEACVLQEEEVEAVKWVPAKEMIDHIMNAPWRQAEYREKVVGAIRERMAHK